MGGLGPPPWKPPKRGPARAAYEWREWRKGLLGWAVACALLAGGVLMIGDWERSQPLVEWAGRLTLVLVIWLIFWPVAASASVAARRSRRSRRNGPASRSAAGTVLYGRARGGPIGPGRVDGVAEMGDHRQQDESDAPRGRPEREGAGA